MREVVLHGELAKRFGKNHLLDVKSPAEAVRALCANFPDFERHMVESRSRGVGYNVWSNGRNIGEGELKMIGRGRIYISPVIIGSKKGGLLQVILGAVLIIIGAVIDILTYGTGGNQLIAIGGAMLIGGVIQLLTPLPKTSGGSDQVTSSFFNGPVNTTAQGNPVPIGYGLLMVGSVVISGEIEITSTDLNAGPIHGGGGGSGGGLIP
jgi:predicted phage tail protein